MSRKYHDRKIHISFYYVDISKSPWIKCLEFKMYSFIWALVIRDHTYTVFITKLANPFTLHINPPAKQFIQPCAFVIASVHHAHLTPVKIVRPAARRTFTLTHTELLLRVDKYEPHNFRQSGNEQSIVILRLMEQGVDKNGVNPRNLKMILHPHVNCDDLTTNLHFVMKIRT